MYSMSRVAVCVRSLAILSSTHNLKSFSYHHGMPLLCLISVPQLPLKAKPAMKKSLACISFSVFRQPRESFIHAKHLSYVSTPTNRTFGSCSYLNIVCLRCILPFHSSLLVLRIGIFNPYCRNNAPKSFLMQSFELCSFVLGGGDGGFPKSYSSRPTLAP